MKLSRENIKHIAAGVALKPDERVFSLPEKVLQFGTGVLLRGLPDYFIDKANRQGLFNGRIVVVKSTDGDTDDFNLQDGLYTHCIRGIDQGARKEENIINSSISRVLSASREWESILACAADPGIRIVISNTTEVGISLHHGDLIGSNPPVSFPGKLLAFLYERYRLTGGAADSGLVIIPTELIPDNGKLLRNICLELAIQNGLDETFRNWMCEANDFCDSLVDRIVPGKIPGHETGGMRDALGYTDELMIMSEVYSLWAIETSSPRTRDILSFAQADKGVVITGNIDKYRELKLRLLNSTHTFTCGIALLSGFKTVIEAMNNSFFEQFISEIMFHEIGEAISGRGIRSEEACDFAGQVMERFSNPFIEHQWQSIAMQFTSKIAMRCVPVIQAYYRRFNRVPQHMAIGVSAYILFMRSVRNEQGQYVGKIGKEEYIIRDDKAGMLHTKWQESSPAQVVRAVLEDEELWGTDLTALPGFETAVLHGVRKLAEESTDVASRYQVTSVRA